MFEQTKFKVLKIKWVWNERTNNPRQDDWWIKQTQQIVEANETKLHSITFYSNPFRFVAFHSCIHDYDNNCHSVFFRLDDLTNDTNRMCTTSICWFVSIVLYINSIFANVYWVCVCAVRNYSSEMNRRWRIFLYL